MKKLFILIFLLTISCTNNKVVNNHGYKSLEIKANLIKITESNKNDVVKNIGKPSTISMFDDNTWFYIERKKVNQSVLKLGKSKIKKNIVLQIKYNDQGIVIAKKIYDIDDMNDFKIVKDVTKKTYSDQSIFGSIIKSIEQKSNAPKKNRKRE